MLPSATRFSIWHNVQINVNAFYVVHRVGHEVRDNPIETFRILPSRIAVIWSFAFPLSGLLQGAVARCLALVRATAATL